MNVPRACGAVLGLTLLVIPLLRHLTFEERLAEAKTVAAALAAVKGVTGGLFCGFAGLMVLGFVCDAGKGWGGRALHAAMLLAGLAWCFLHPAGWLLGIPLGVYGGARACGFGRPRGRRP